MSHLPSLAATAAERMQLPAQVSTWTGGSFQDVFGPSTLTQPESLWFVGVVIVFLLAAQVSLALHLEGRGQLPTNPKTI